MNQEAPHVSHLCTNGGLYPISSQAVLQMVNHLLDHNLSNAILEELSCTLCHRYNACTYLAFSGSCANNIPVQNML